MFKVAICDGNIKDLIHIEKMLSRFHELHPQEQYEITKFTDSNILYKRIGSGELSDIYFLDVLTPGKSGIDIGRQIRKMNGESVIIFTAASEEFAMEAYRLHAVRYLIKPIAEEELYEAAAFACYLMKRREEPLYLLRTSAGLVSLAYSGIVYIENKDRMLYVHLIDGRRLKSLFVRTSFEDEVRSLTESAYFLQVHKSFVVNLRYVGKLTTNSMEMVNGDCIPVSKRKYTQVKRKYLLFIDNKYW